MKNNYWFITYCFISSPGNMLVNNIALFGNKYSFFAEERGKFPKAHVTILWAEKITKEEYEYLLVQDIALIKKNLSEKTDG